MESFGSEPALEPSQDLSSRIASQVHRARVVRVRKLVGFGLPLALGVVALASPAVRYIGFEFSRSGFGEYLLLLFSDPGFVFSNLGIFFSALIETAPVVGTALALTAIVFGALAVRNIITAVHPRRFTTNQNHG